MMIEYYFFAFSFFLTLIIILLRKSYFDLWSVFVLSSIFYTYPLLFGYVHDQSSFDFIDVPNTVYIFFTVYFLCTTIFLLVDKLRPIEYLSIPTISKIPLLSLIFLTYSFLILIFIIDPFFFFKMFEDGYGNPSKFSIIFPLFTWSALIAFAMSILYKDNKFVLISIIPILLSLLIPSRLFVSIALIIFLMLYSRKFKPKRLIKNYIIGFYLIIAIIVLIIFKIALPLVVNADWQTLLIQTSDFNSYIYRFTRGSESNAVMLNFVFATESLNENLSNYRVMFFISLIPFLRRFIADAIGIDFFSFGDAIKMTYYPEVNYGVASSFFGQIYFVFYGMVFSIIFIVLFHYLVNILNRKFILDVNKFVFFLPFAVYATFFFHREEAGDVIYIFSISLIILLIQNFLFIILKKK